MEQDVIIKKKIWFKESKIEYINNKLLNLKDSNIISNHIKPFWTNESIQISKKLWIPNKLNISNSIINNTNEQNNSSMGNSWFSINKKSQDNINSSFILPSYILPNPVPNNDPVIPLKTIKLRLFPTKQEKDDLQLIMSQFRWYYNASVSITNTHYKEKLIDKKSYTSESIRDLMRKYDYIESKENNQVIKSFVQNKTKNEVPIPTWWTNIHSRIPRGAVNKYVSSLNSTLTKFRSHSISNFEMKFRSKKEPTDYLHFEDASFPAFIKKIKSHYWFRTNGRKRTKIGFNDIKTKKRGLEIIYEKATDRYFLHYPVERNWFPETDKRIENQDILKISENRIISLDPGIRKFMVGYDPDGSSIFIGEGANIELIKLLYTIDKYESKGKNTFLLWKQIKNKVAELHWKTIYYLIKNYDMILLPDFRISEMVKGKKLHKNTKRLMYMYSFHSFKEKLKHKCTMYQKKLIIVDESYTSCTCGQCGHINQVKGKEVFECNKCSLKMDRDVGGSRNILLKNLKQK